jgi:hypothetical protein
VAVAWSARRGRSAGTWSLSRNHMYLFLGHGGWHGAERRTVEAASAVAYSSRNGGELNRKMEQSAVLVPDGACEAKC